MAIKAIAKWDDPPSSKQVNLNVHRTPWKWSYFLIVNSSVAMSALPLPCEISRFAPAKKLVNRRSKGDLWWDHGDLTKGGFHWMYI